MRSVGRSHFERDMSALQLFDHFAAGRGEFNRQGLGSLVWFGDLVTKITHVAMMIDNYQMVEAGGALTNLNPGRCCKSRCNGSDMFTGQPLRQSGCD